jgi:23S rRNA (guanosine2251-2'-O)-methyltransferase
MRDQTKPSEAGWGAELIFGSNAIWEALEAGVEMGRIYLARGVRRRGVLLRILNRAEEQKVPVEVVEREVLSRASRHHQGVAAEVAPYRYSSLNGILQAFEGERASGLVLVLDCLQDVQNFGSLLRAAEAVGVAGVIIPARRAAQVTAAVRRTSAGAVEHLKVARVTNLARALDELKEKGFWIVGLENLPQAQDYADLDWRGKMALVVGSEGQGIRRLVRERCDILARIPMQGRIGSLNAAVAGSIVLYHAWRAQGQGSEAGG